MGTNKEFLEGVELIADRVNTPEIYIVFNGNVEYVNVTINHFNSDEEEE